MPSLSVGSEAGFAKLVRVKSSNVKAVERSNVTRRLSNCFLLLASPEKRERVCVCVVREWETNYSQ